GWTSDVCASAGQWQKNSTAISGATSASYNTPAMTSADNGAQFRVVVSNVAGNVTSNAATLTVNAAGTMAKFGHVFIVIGENSAYSSTYNKIGRATWRERV